MANLKLMVRCVETSRKSGTVRAGRALKPTARKVLLEQKKEAPLQVSDAPAHLEARALGKSFNYVYLMKKGR